MTLSDATYAEKREVLTMRMHFWKTQMQTLNTIDNTNTKSKVIRTLILKCNTLSKLIHNVLAIL